MDSLGTAIIFGVLGAVALALLDWTRGKDFDAVACIKVVTSVCVLPIAAEAIWVCATSTDPAELPANWRVCVAIGGLLAGMVSVQTAVRAYREAVSKSAVPADLTNASVEGTTTKAIGAAAAAGATTAIGGPSSVVAGTAVAEASNRSGDAPDRLRS